MSDTAVCNYEVDYYIKSAESPTVTTERMFNLTGIRPGAMVTFHITPVSCSGVRGSASIVTAHTSKLMFSSEQQLKIEKELLVHSNTVNSKQMM